MHACVDCFSHRSNGYLGCIQAGETVIMRGLLWYEHKAAQEATDQFILQPQYTDNPQNICRVITNALQSSTEELALDASR